MIIVWIVLIASFVLESIVTNMVGLNSVLLPMFSIVSLVIIYPYFNNNDSYFLRVCAISGLFYDIVFTNTLFLNASLFLVIGLILKKINSAVSNNHLNVPFMTGLIIIFYRVVTYVILLIVNYIDFNGIVLLRGIINSLVINIAYAAIVYAGTDYYSRKYKITKID
jgi:rod shape-determining protein MreD